MKILLVDDDPIVLMALSPSLLAANLDVETATSGEAAIEICKKSPPRLAVLDMRMPGMDGLAVARWLREHTEVPFLFLSAYSDEGTVKQAAEAGAMDFLTKPVDPLQLVQIVQQLLGVEG